MGKIGKKVREDLGLIEKEEPKEEQVEVAEAQSFEELPEQQNYNTYSIGLRESKKDGQKSWECVMVYSKDSVVVRTESLSSSPRLNKHLALEDWKLHMGKMMLKELYR
jgi:hypothetical protein